MKGVLGYLALPPQGSLRISLQALTIDVARNQGRAAYKRTLHRTPEVVHLRHARRPTAHGSVHSR